MPLSTLRGENSTGRWTEQDGLLAQALTYYESLVCDGCGQMVTESMDPTTEREWSAPPPTRCHACTAIARRARDYEGSEVPAPSALRFHAVRRPTGPNLPGDEAHGGDH